MTGSELTVRGLCGAALSVVVAVTLLACRPSRPAGVADLPLPIDAGPDVIDVSSGLQKVRKHWRVPAIAAAAFDSTRLLAIGAVGERKAASGVRVTADDQWHLGSNTKTMTATLLAGFVDRNALRWDSTLDQLFSPQTVERGWQKVTLAQLLSHHGGAPASLTDLEVWSHMLEHRSDSVGERSHVVDQLLRAPPPEKVGSFVYSNAGYMIASEAVERMTKSSWEDLMQREVFAPLGMTCGFGGAGKCLDGAACRQPTEPVGHRAEGEDLYIPVPPGPLADNPLAVGPAGTVHCDLRSWGRFLQEHLRAARGEPTTIAKAETLRHLQDDAGDEHGLGWILAKRRWAKGRVIHMLGSNTLSYSNVWIAPELDHIYVAVTNGGSDDDFEATDEAIGVLTRALGDE